MFIARSVLTMSALYLKLDPYKVECAGMEQNEYVAQMRILDTKIRVLHDPHNGMKVRAFIESDKDNLWTQTGYIEAGDYGILADVFSAAINGKYFSCPWVAAGTQALLPSDVIIDRVFSLSSIASRFALKSSDGNYVLNLTLESNAGNSANNYCYTLYNEKNEVALQIANGKDFVQVTNALANVISESYHNWLSKADRFTKSVKLPFDLKGDLFHFYENLLAKAKKENVDLKFERYTAKEFIITNAKQGMTYIVTYDNYTGEDLLYGKSTTKENDEYKLLVRAPGTSELAAKSIKEIVFKA